MALVKLKKQNLPSITAYLGVLVYVLLAAYQANYGYPNMDEGSFLLKGYTILTGKYAFLQPYTYWFNKMYVTFFAFGFVQWLFGPGLLSGRVFAFLLNIGAILMVWRHAQKYAKGWMVALAVWGMALSFPWIQILSKANSQVVVHFVLTAILVVFTTPKRRLALDLLGGALVAVLLLTRENMWFFLPPWILYLFLTEKPTRAFQVLAIFGVLFSAGVLIYYPEVTSLWARGIGIKQLSTLDAKVAKADSVPFEGRILSFANGVQAYALLYFYSLLSLWSLPSNLGHIGEWDHRQKVRWFLFGTLLLLLASHAIASLGLSYCVYCFTSYEGFFSVISVFFIIFSADEIQSSIQKSLRLTFASVGFFVLTLVLAFNRQVSDALSPIPVPKNLVVGAPVELATLVTNKLGLTGLGLDLAISVGAFILGFAVLLIIASAAARKIGKRTMAVALHIAVIMTVALLPLATWQRSRCDGESIPMWYEKIGKQIRVGLPSSAIVYIDGANASLPLMYFSEAEFFPPQVNNYYSYKNEPDTDALLRTGRWNEELRQKWINTANTIILDKDTLESYDQEIDLSGWQRTNYAYPEGGCTPKIEYYVFVKP